MRKLLLVLISLIIIVSFNNKHTAFINEVVYNGNNLRVSIDGNIVKEMPKEKGYYLSYYVCDNKDTKVSWDSEELELNISNKKIDSCNIYFESMPYLSGMKSGDYVKYLNKMHDLNVDAEDIRDWEIAKFFPSLTKEEVMEPLTIESFWKTVDVDVKSLLYLRKLYDEGHDIYIVTATDYRNIKAKIDYILKPYFPFINLDHIIISHDKTMIKGDVLVDDYINNLLGGDYTGYFLQHLTINILM